jgi:hypothetical protein
VLLILASPNVLLEPSGRERGRSIPFATFRGAAAIRWLSE